MLLHLASHGLGTKVYIDLDWIEVFYIKTVDLYIDLCNTLLMNQFNVVLLNHDPNFDCYLSASTNLVLYCCVNGA